MQLLNKRGQCCRKLSGTQGGVWRNRLDWDGVHEGQGTLTIATIFLTAFRQHVRGMGEKGLLIACTQAIHKGYKGSAQQEG